MKNVFTFKKTQAPWISVVLFCFLFVLPVHAADPKPTIRHEEYQAQYVSQSIADPIVLEQGETKTITIHFKNTGTETWNSLSSHPNGYRHVSAYTMVPRDRDSLFKGANWISKKQTGSIAKDTKTGETADLVIDLIAPQTTGEYTEEFYLAAENYTWINGGYFFLKITIKEKTAAETKTKEIKKEIPTATTTVKEKQTKTKTNATNPTQAFFAQKVFQSKNTVKAKGGKKINIIITYQNTGTEAWPGYTLYADVTPDGTIGDDSWETEKRIVSSDTVIAPASSTKQVFVFRTPEKKGTYTARFHLVVNEKTREEADVIIPVTVTKNAPSSYEPAQLSPDDTVVGEPRLSEEPRIRVGLWSLEDDPMKLVEFLSADDAYLVFKGTENMGELSQGIEAQMQYVGGVSMFSGGDVSFQTNEYVRLEPKTNPHAIFELVNYEHEVSWKAKDKNFNRYRGAMEYRMGERTEQLYVVNDLLFEDYVKGIGENSNGSPEEYLKAQTVAQRSYAYAIQANDKYGIFDVTATTADQLYLGVGSEEVTPRFVAAAEATRGMMVTYETNVVITPYFGHAGCSTKSWEDVWGGEKPWLVPVATTYDCAAGRTQYGHGVGMSQLDASERAEKEGLDWRSIVTYYYTGVEIERMYF